MKVLREIAENKDLAIALGYFDGVHIGHKKIINTLIQKARVADIKTAVITFDKNPANYFSEEQVLNIQTYKDRELILAALGINYLYELNFEDYMELSAEEYLEEILIKNFNPKIIVVGYNHTFGKNKEGNPAFLQKYASKYNYECIVVPEIKYRNKEEVSSSAIRKRIEHGHLNAIKSLLGRYFSVRNSVVHGDGKGRLFGFPTANLVWPSSMKKLPYGVYWGYAQIDLKIYPALISWGVKPTVSSDNEEMLEAHIYDFHEDLYGKIIKIIFAKKMRKEQNFGNANALKAQIQDDYVAFEKWAKTRKK